MDMLEPGKFGIAVPFKKRYENFIGGQWIAPVNKQYFDNTTPVTGKVFCSNGIQFHNPIIFLSMIARNITISRRRKSCNNISAVRSLPDVICKVITASS